MGYAVETDSFVDSDQLQAWFNELSLLIDIALHAALFPYNTVYSFESKWTFLHHATHSISRFFKGLDKLIYLSFLLILTHQTSANYSLRQTLSLLFIWKSFANSGTI